MNLDPLVLETLYEAKYMQKFNYHVPDVVLKMCANEHQLKVHNDK